MMYNVQAYHTDGFCYERFNIVLIIIFIAECVQSSNQSMLETLPYDVVRNEAYGLMPLKPLEV